MFPDPENIYQEKGYKNRKEYLKAMSEDYNVDIFIVVGVASVLGREEDFDGLIVALEDAST